MRKLYGSDDHLIVGHLRQILEDHRIRCIVRNEYLLGGSGELPPNECWPELWVAEDAQYERARALVDEVLARDGSVASPWHCPECDEPLEGQFTSCWQCGAERPAPD